MTAAALEAHPDPHKWTALALAVAVHLLLAAFLVLGVSWRTSPPAAVEVELIPASPQPETAAPPSAPRPAPEAKAPPPQAVPVPLPKPDIAIKDRDKPKPPPKTPPPESERTSRDRTLPDRQAEALAREMQQLENKKLNQQLERELARAKEDNAAAARAEAEARAQAAARAAEAQLASARARLIANYQDRIRGKIRGNIVRPPDLRGNPVVRFDVTQLPSGDIIDVVLTAPSGNRAWDESVERAIRKSSPLPKPEGNDLYQRILHLTFCPDEERGCR